MKTTTTTTTNTLTVKLTKGQLGIIREWFESGRKGAPAGIWCQPILASKEMDLEILSEAECSLIEGTLDLIVHARKLNEALRGDVPPKPIMPPRPE